MSKRAHRVREDEGLNSVVGAANELIAKALINEDVDKVASLANVGTVGPYELVPPSEIQSMKLREGRLQAAGIGMAAEANIARNLSFARKQARLTQQEAAELVGVSESTIARTERGERIPSIGELTTMCTVYGVHVERVLGLIDAERELLLDAYEFGTPTIRAKIIEVAQGAQAGRSPETRVWIAADSKRHKEQLTQRLKELKELNQSTAD